MPSGRCRRCGKNFQESLCAECRTQRPGNPILTFRERQVVELVARAKSNKEIAFQLHLTVGTVKEYLVKIFDKTGVSNRTELALWSIKGLVDG